jgi:hypothetical protein
VKERYRTCVTLMVELKRVHRFRSVLLNSPILRTVLKPFSDPFTKAFLGDREYANRMRNILERFEAGDDPVFYDAPAAIMIHSRVLIPTPKEDPVLAGYAICLAAQAMGLGSCFVTLAQNAINSSRRCRAIIGLSPEGKVHAVVLVGHPAVLNLRGAPRASKEIRYA